MCINTGLAEAGLENIEPQKGTETISYQIVNHINRTIREYRTPEGDGNVLSTCIELPPFIIREYRTPEGDGNIFLSS